jgi:hypothetical protein
MTDKTPDIVVDQDAFDAVLKRMINTPPKPFTKPNNPENGHSKEPKKPRT